MAQDAWDEGYDAYMDRIPWDQNPYNPYTDPGNYNAWSLGWQQAAEDD